MNTINIQALVGTIIVTSRDLTVDNTGTVFEARRRHPAEDDILLPKGAQVTAIRVERGRLVCEWNGALIAMHPNHLPGSTYGQPKVGPAGLALQAWKGAGTGIAAAVAQDPELMELAKKLQERKAEKQLAQLKESEKQRLLAELAALGE